MSATDKRVETNIIHKTNFAQLDCNSAVTVTSLLCRDIDFFGSAGLWLA